MKLSAYATSCFALIILTISSVMAGIVPRRAYAPSAQQELDMMSLREASQKATQRHRDNPSRCSMFRALQLIELDTRAIYKKMTGRDMPDCGGYACTSCRTIFDDYTQATFHDCS